MRARPARHLVPSLLVMAAVLLLPFALPPAAHAQTQPWGGVCVVNETATIQGLECLLANILTVFIALIGLAAFIMIIIAAFRYMLFGSSTKDADQARKTITFAIVGIVVALSAFIILNVLSAFTGVDLTRFLIPRDTDTYPTLPAAGGAP